MSIHSGTPLSGVYSRSQLVDLGTDLSDSSLLIVEKALALVNSSTLCPHLPSMPPMSDQFGKPAADRIEFGMFVEEQPLDVVAERGDERPTGRVVQALETLEQKTLLAFQIVLHKCQARSEVLQLADDTLFLVLVVCRRRISRRNVRFDLIRLAQ